MKLHIAVRTALVVAAVGACVVIPTGTASADPPQTGCPDGYTVMTVAGLTARGYRVPARVDDPTSGIKSFGSYGNGDGLICAQEVGNRTTPWGDQLYQFWDNTLPASP